MSLRLDPAFACVTLNNSTTQNIPALILKRRQWRGRYWQQVEQCWEDIVEECYSTHIHDLLIASVFVQLLHRNGTFVPPAPSTRTRWQVKTGFRQKTGRSRTVCESIRKIPTGKIKDDRLLSKIWINGLMVAWRLAGIFE